MQKQEEAVYKLRQGAQVEVSEVQSRTLNNKTTWRIPYNQRWEYILRNMQSSSVKIIQIKNEGTKKMFNTISSIHFYSLIQINLSNLNLVSTEPLLFLDSPQLQYIWLNSNKLCNIKSLRKMNFPKLKQLFIFDNLIMDFSPLTELHGNKQELKMQISKTKKMPYIGAMRSVKYRNPIQIYNIFFKLPQNIKLIDPLIKCLNLSLIMSMLHQKYAK